MRCLLGTAAACWAALAAARAACADGVMLPVTVEVGRSTKAVASPRQEAVLATDGRTVQVVLRTHFRSGPKELAWIVPVPARPERVEKADGGLFRRLEELTAPRFLVTTGGTGPPFACGCGAAGGEAPHVAGRSVVVESSGTAGIFEYVVLSATKADDLTAWLNEHRYLVPVGAERVFARYVADRWHWLAMRVRPGAGEAGTLAPHPVRYTYRDSRLIYPLEISRLSADLTNEIVLYVVAGGRRACGNWHNAVVDPSRVARDPASASGTNYERLLGGLCEARRGRVFVTELARTGRVFGHEDDSRQINGVLDAALLKALGSDQTLTRLRAIMTPRAMDRDVALLPAATWEPVSNTFDLSAADGPPGAIALALPLLPLAAAGVGLRLLDGRGRRRAAALACLAAACVAAAVM